MRSRPAPASRANKARSPAKNGLETPFDTDQNTSPEHLAGDRLHEGGDVQPLGAVVTERDRPLTFGRPDPAQDRLQANAVLVGRPDLDRRARVLRPLLGDGLLQLFLNVSRSSGVAAAGWRGRGFCTDQPIAFRASVRTGRGSKRSGSVCRHTKLSPLPPRTTASRGTMMPSTAAPSFAATVTGCPTLMDGGGFWIAKCTTLACPCSVRLNPWTVSVSGVPSLAIAEASLIWAGLSWL